MTNYKKGFYVFYTEHCTPSIRRFPNLIERTKFVADFLLDSQDNEDNWIDGTFEGTLSLADTGTNYIENES